MDLVGVNVGRRGMWSYIFLGISKLGVMKPQRAMEFYGIFLLVCSLCFCVPSRLTWVDSCSYLVYVSSRAFRVSFSHIICEKVLQGYHTLVNGSQGWSPASPIGMHVKVRANRKYFFNWVSQISPQPSKSKGKKKAQGQGR